MNESVKFINPHDKANNLSSEHSLNNLDKIILFIKKNMQLKYTFKIINSLLFFIFYFYKISTTDSQVINFQNLNLTEETDIIEKSYQFAENGTIFNHIREKRRKNPFLSIIIPIFNNEKNIKK